MKYIRFIICLIFTSFIFLKGNSQSWIRQESNINTDLLDIHFINQEIGFAVGNNGVILKTSDGGNQWVLKSSGTTNDLVSICFPDSLTGFAISSSEVLKSTDGGETWQVKDTVLNTNLTHIHFVGQDTGFIVGRGRMLITMDKGASWIKREIPGLSFNNFWATDSKTLYDNETDFLILKSTDGGENWFVSHDYGVVGNWRDMFFTSKEVGYVLGRGTAQGFSWGMIVKTTNGGNDWTLSGYKELDSYLNSIFFISDSVGYVVGNKVLKTEDAGESWIDLNCNENSELTSVYFTDLLTGYIVGSNGTILKTDKGGISFTSSPVAATSIKLYPNPVNDILHIELINPSIQNSEISIYTITGDLSAKHIVRGDQAFLKVADLHRGFYIVSITNKEQTVCLRFYKQ